MRSRNHTLLVAAAIFQIASASASTTAISAEQQLAAENLSKQLSTMMPKWTQANRSLLEYMFPASTSGGGRTTRTRDETQRWVPYSQGCSPTGKIPFIVHRPSGSAAPCLFTQTRPSKHLAIVALARQQRVTHIIEEGIYGGLSMYV